MKHTAKLSVALSILTLAAAALAQEHKIQRGQLPPAVEKTLQLQSKGAEIKDFTMEKEHGKDYYEAEMMIDGHSKDVEMDANGRVTEVEEQVAIDSLPAQVKAGLQAKAGQGKLTKVESLTKHEKLVAYEAQVMTGGKHSEVQVGPSGSPLSHEE